MSIFSYMSHYITFLNNLLFNFNYAEYSSNSIIASLDYIFSVSLDHFLIKIEYYMNWKVEDYFYWLDSIKFFLLTIIGILIYELIFYYIWKKISHKINTPKLNKFSITLIRLIPILCFFAPFFTWAKKLKKNFLLINSFSCYLLWIVISAVFLKSNINILESISFILFLTLILSLIINKNFS